MSNDSFRKLLARTMPESLILFDHEFYKQHSGVGIGSPLEPALSDRFSLFWWKKLASKLPFLISRYVDDTFLPFRLKHHIGKFQNYLNRQHKNIRFTSETENEISMLFLNIKISRDNNKFTTSVYRKPTCSGIFTNFGNLFPKSYKYNLLFTISDRGSKLFSNFELFDKSKSTFENNGYSKLSWLPIKKYVMKFL